MTVHSEALSDAVGYGTAAARTSARVAGRLYYATDTGVLSRDNGTSWDTIPTGSVLTVQEVDGSPSGTATALVLPNGTVSIVGTTATYTPPSVASPGTVLLESHTAASSATLDFTTRNAPGQSGALIQSDYDEYEFHFIGVVPATNNVDFYCRFSTGGVFDSSAHYVNASYLEATSGSVEIHATLTAFVARNNGEINSASSKSVAGRLIAYNPASATQEKWMQGDILWAGSTNWIDTQFSGIWTQTTSVVDGVRFLFSSGNIASGTIRAYGVAK